MSTQRYYNLPPAVITSKGKKMSDADFTEKLLNDMLYDLIGKPGKSAGKAQNSITANAGTSGMSGDSTSMYTAAQQDTYSGAGAGGTALGAGIGLIRDLLAYAHADKAAKVAYNRQNEFYNNHLSMPAKVDEYKEAGLNPMGLAGSGPGATSAPSVDSATTPDASGAIEVLGQILNYKLGLKQLEIDKEKTRIQEQDVASQIEYRTEQKLYQQKINDWFDTNQIVSINKQLADTADALQKVRTGVAQEALNYAGVTKAQAEAFLVFQQGMQKMWENSPEWRDVELKLKRAQANSANANAAYTYESIQNLASERQALAAKAALDFMNTAQGAEQLEILGIQKEQQEFIRDHQRGDMIINRISGIGNAIKDAGLGIASVLTAAKGVPVITRESSGQRVTKTYDKDNNYTGKTVTASKVSSSGSK